MWKLILINFMLFGQNTPMTADTWSYNNFGPLNYEPVIGPPRKLFRLGSILQVIFLALIISALILVNLGYSSQQASFQYFAQNLGFGSNASLINLPAKADLAGLVSKVSSGVVSIDMYKSHPRYEVDYSFDPSGETQSFRQIRTVKTRVASGSGFLVTNSGYILTNAHVVFDTQASYVVTLDNGRQFDGSVAFRDPTQDLAVVKIDGQNLPTEDLGDSSKVKLNQTVLGIGNAYGELDNASSNGIVTALNRAIIADGPISSERLTGLIQTNAQMYPGDSGGPLFDANGKVIGINVAISQDSSESYSIPINLAKNILSQANVSL